jgi:alpha-ketoglutaric semialdehyde dehydrogenase
VSATAQYPNLVGGEWRPSSAGGWFEVRDPADSRTVLGEVPAMTPGDVADVYDHAARAASAWARTSAITRGRVLLEAAALLRSRSADVARELTREMGKTLAESLGEVGKSADFLEYCGGLGRAPWGELLADERPATRAWTVREPLGVVLAVCPWNDPLLTPARKVGPALIAGNAVVLKPASATPLVSLQLARALADAGLPAGVLQTVTGAAGDIGGAIIDHPALAAVSFTGSNEVGEGLRRELAHGRTKVLLELGGKNATVVLADADLDAAADTIAAAAFAQAGQRCTATSRVLAAAPVAEALVERLVERAGRQILGPGLEPSTTMGPLVSDDQRRSVAGFVDRAQGDGAEAAYGAGGLQRPELEHGSFYAPTILTNVRADMEIWRDEVFGPVVAVAPVADIEEAIATVNDSAYGLAAAVFTRDLSTAMKFADEVEAGQVAINRPTSGWDVHMPFGGFKDSGSGTKEQGLEGVHFYTRTKTVVLGTA